MQQSHRYAELRREIVVLQEIVCVNDLAHLILELWRLGPFPIFVPTGHVVLAGAALRIETRGASGKLAGMTARAVFGKNIFASVQDLLACLEKLVASMTRSVFEGVSGRGLQKKCGHRGILGLGGGKVDGVLPRYRNFDG